MLFPVHFENHFGAAQTEPTRGSLANSNHVAVEKLIILQPIELVAERPGCLNLVTQYTIPAKCKTNLIKKGWREIMLYLSCLYRME